MPVSEWIGESGNPGRVQGGDVIQVWMVFEAPGLDDIT